MLFRSRQRLTGNQALQYVRFRGDTQGDFGRMLRQQEFLKVIADETLRASTILKLPQLLEQAARHIRTDMSIPQLLNFGRRASGLNFDEVVTVTLPGKNINVNGVAYVQLDEEVLNETVRLYLQWEEDELSSEVSMQQ